MKDLFYGAIRLEVRRIKAVACLTLYFLFKSQLEYDQPQYLQPRDMIKSI